jgi:soluble lytic murein transglycosylase-like protein
MTTARSVCVAMGALALLACVKPAGAVPVDQYLKLRRLHKTDRTITYAQVTATPAQFVQKVIELKGTVNGSIRRDSGLAFLLTMDDSAAVLLEAPAADLPIVSNVASQKVRVLARVSEPKNGNVVPFEVLGVAYDAEVALKEEEAARKDTEEAARRQAESEAQKARAAPRAELGSRSGYGRQTTMTAPVRFGEISDLARRNLAPEAQAIYPAYRDYIARCNRRLSYQQVDMITTSLLYFAVHHKVDPRLVVAVFIAESDFDPRCTSNKGAMGIGQIMPDEARRMGVRDPYDPMDNVRASIALLKEKLIKYNEGTPDGVLTLRQVQLALAAYNAGPGAVKKYGGIPPYRETQGYIKRILKRYAELCGE